MFLLTLSEKSPHKVINVARQRRKAWYLDTRGFIPKKIQWHIHAGPWSLVNWWCKVLMRHYIRCSWILMRVAVGLVEWPRPWWWSVYRRDTPTINTQKLSSVFCPWGEGACVAGGHAWWRVCVAERVCMAGGHVCWVCVCGTHAPPADTTRYVNERAVRILLKCILVESAFISWTCLCKSNQDMTFWVRN